MHRSLISSRGRLIAKRLEHGDTLGVIAPASAVLDPQKWEDGIAVLERSGFRVKIGAHAREKPYGFLSAQDPMRTKDLHAMFADPDIAAIFFAKGGYGSNRLLDLVDYSMVASFPKILIGYSDATFLLLAIYAKTGLCTFHGPMPTHDLIASEHAQQNLTMMLDVLMHPSESRAIPNPSGSDLHAIAGGKSAGILIGGNLTNLMHLIGTPFMPDLENAILFLEDLDEDPYRIDRYLVHLRLAGVLDRISGIILGDFPNCINHHPEKPSFTLEEVFQDNLQGLGIPVISGFSFGHAGYMPTFPIGVEAELDADRGELRLTESPVQ